MNRLIAVCGILICIGMAISIYAQVLLVGIYVPTYHMDGAFQTASGLFRLAEGQLPQRDFFPYLGIGPIYLIFPVFMLFGEDLMASVQAAYLVTMLAAWMSASVIWRLVFAEYDWRYAPVGGAIVIVLGLFFSQQTENLDYFQEFFEPGNSLRPIRGALPFFIAIIVFATLRSGLGQWQKTAVMSVMFGCIMLWSNDFALPTFATFFVLVSVHFLLSQGLKGWIHIVVMGGMAVVIWLALLTLITQGHALQFLKANYVDVAGTQWWYFPPFVDSTRVYQLSDLVRILLDEANDGVLVVIFLIGYFLRNQKLETGVLMTAGLTVFLGGLLPTAVAFSAGYFVGLKNFAIVFLIVGAFRLGHLGFCFVVSARPRLANALTVGAALIASFTMLGVGKNALDEYNETLAFAVDSDDVEFSETLNAYVHVRWKDYFAFADMRKDDVVIEEYWGLWSAINGQFADWPADSVIHIFGDARNTAIGALDDARYVTTSRFDVHPDFQPWSFTQNYWFYRVLLREFDVVGKSLATVIWQRSAQPRSFDDASCRVAENGKDLILDDEVAGFYEVTVSYSVATPSRRLLLLRNNLGGGPGGRGLASLPAGGNEATIPVWVNSETGFVLQSFLTGKTPQQARFSSCEAKRIDFEDRDVFRYTAPDCATADAIKEERICSVAD